MFERFTERARKVVVLAQEEASRLRHDYVGTEHLLMGLICEEEGLAAQVLSAAGVTIGSVREQVESIVGLGEDEPGSQAPFTPRAKKVLEQSLRESMHLGQNYIGTEHLLLGLLREDEGVAAMVLSNLGTDPQKVRQDISSRLGEGARSRSRGDLGPLGWARDALQRSFGRYPRAEDRASFEKFTQPGRRVVVLAQDEARHFNHNYIGTEHVLLGLIREEDGVAAEALRGLGVDLNEAREQIEGIIGYGEEPTGAQAPFTPRTTKVLQLALRESMQLGHDYVGTEHVLLGLVREPEGVTARVLSNLDVDPDTARREIMRRLSGVAPESDQLDEAGRRMEEGWILFRGRVSGVTAELAVPHAPAVTVDADYAYRVPRSSRDGSGILLGDVLDTVRTELYEMEARNVESVVMALGERMLVAFPEMLEVSLTVSGVPNPGDPDDATSSLSATIRR